MPTRHRAGASSWSVLSRVEEIVLAASGADSFETVFSVASARLAARRGGGEIDTASRSLRADVTTWLERARRAWPGLEVARGVDVPDDVLRAIIQLLDRAHLEGDAEGIDALFEQLVTRVGKGSKGQFFTPRHVVDFATRALGLRAGERLLDPACGSGAFVAHARATPGVHASGWDVDARAVRVARLLAIVTGGDPRSIDRRDSLAGRARKSFDAIATNPPFAGILRLAGYEVSGLAGRVERDALFVERCLALLRPGGRLAVVLPHGKASSVGWAAFRRWLFGKARVFAVVSLPKETFLPHTSQRAVLVLARKRLPAEAVDPTSEPLMLFVSRRAGRDAGGRPVFREAKAGGTWRDHDHDLGSIERELLPFLRREGFGAPSASPSPRRPLTSSPSESRPVVRRRGDLGEDVSLAPERYVAPSLNDGARGVDLGSLVVVRRETLGARDAPQALVVDTTHAKDGLLDLPAARRARAPARSAKKIARAGDLLVSRLRPYLRQIAFVHPASLAAVGAAFIACSTEYYVLSPRGGAGAGRSERLEFLLPLLLGAPAQAVLAAGQEGGHHPRVPLATLLSLRVPDAALRGRARRSARIDRALAEAYRALDRVRGMLEG
jgi:type I restriction enzyme M protein